MDSLLAPLRDALGGGTLSVWLVIAGVVAVWLALRAVRKLVRMVLGAAALGLFLGAAPLAGTAVPGAVADCAAAEVASATPTLLTQVTKRVTTETLSPDATCQPDGVGLATGSGTVRSRTVFDLPLQTWEVTPEGAVARLAVSLPAMPDLPGLGRDPSVPRPVTGTWSAVVDRVVDGDTMRLRVTDPSGQPIAAGEEIRARLLRIDTPELGRDGQPSECLAEAARDHLEGLAPPGTEVVAAWDVERTDVHGRQLVHLWADTVWLNGRMLADGYATVMTFPPNVAHDDAVRALERQAREAGRGLWAAC